MPPRFDHYVIVDWSAANTRKTGKDSIWVCHRGPDGEQVENPPTRHGARLLLGDILAAVTVRGERAVLGFDFPFGYPAGFAARLGLDGIPWRAVWDEVARLVVDGEDNRSNRFEVGNALNERVSGGAFPFWGCPAGRSYPFLAPRHHNGHAADGLAEKRLIDHWMVGAQPCWKLAYTGSVGSQVLTGLPVVRALRDDPRWAAGARVWPFETGLALPEEVRVVFAEVWPSWWKWKPTQQPAEVNDRAQVRHVAALFAEADRTGELASWFAGAPGLTGAQRLLVESEEAWTLGVTVRRQPRPTPALPRKAGTGEEAIAATATLPRKRGRLAWGLSPSLERRPFDYLRNPGAIYRASFAAIRARADLSRFPASLRPLALRLAHAAGDVSILADLAWSRGAAIAGRRALAAGAAIIVDGAMLTAGIIRERLPARNPVICTLREPAVAGLAASLGTTRSAAAAELWRPHLAGSVVAIGNAPTALFHLLEIVAAGAGRPALVLGFPVGFIGAAEAKVALAGSGLPYIALHGTRGGSALAAAAVNALGREPSR